MLTSCSTASGHSTAPDTEQRLRRQWSPRAGYTLRRGDVPRAPDAVGHRTPCEAGVPRNRVTAARGDTKDTNEVHSKWFFGNRRLPFWAGFTVGYEIAVDSPRSRAPRQRRLSTRRQRMFSHSITSRFPPRRRNQDEHALRVIKCGHSPLVPGKRRDGSNQGVTAGGDRSRGRCCCGLRPQKHARGSPSGRRAPCTSKPAPAAPHARRGAETGFRAGAASGPGANHPALDRTELL